MYQPTPPPLTLLNSIIPLTEVLVEDLLILIAVWLPDLQIRLVQPQIAESARLVIEILPDAVLRDALEDVLALLAQEMAKRVLLRVLGELPEVIWGRGRVGGGHVTARSLVKDEISERLRGGESILN